MGGGDRYTLLNIYRAFILSKLTYGCEAFGSASKSLLGELEIVQNLALRISSGALRSTHVLALQCEVHVPSILTVVEKLNVKYFMKTKYMTDDHTIKVELTNDLQNIENLRWNYFSYKVPGVLRAFHSRFKWNLPDIRNIENDRVSPIPPWINLNLEIRSNMELIIIELTR